MSDYTSFLVTILYCGGLVQCALRVHNDKLPNGIQYRLGHEDSKLAIHDLLPLHVRSCGPVVEVTTIFECMTVE